MAEYAHIFKSQSGCDKIPVKRQRTQIRARNSLLIRTTLILLCGCLLLTTSLNAQQPWEYDPYQVRIWMATDDVPELTAGIRQNILRSIVWQAEVAEGSAWRIAAQRCPEILRHDMLHRLDELAAASSKNSDGW